MMLSNKRHCKAKVRVNPYQVGSKEAGEQNRRRHATKSPSRRNAHSSPLRNTNAILLCVISPLIVQYTIIPTILH